MGWVVHCCNGTFSASECGMNLSRLPAAINIPKLTIQTHCHVSANQTKDSAGPGVAVWLMWLINWVTNCFLPSAVLSLVHDTSWRGSALCLYQGLRLGQLQVCDQHIPCSRKSYGKELWQNNNSCKLKQTQLSWFHSVFLSLKPPSRGYWDYGSDCIQFPERHEHTERKKMRGGSSLCFPFFLRDMLSQGPQGDVFPATFSSVTRRNLNVVKRNIILLVYYITLNHSNESILIFCVFVRNPYTNRMMLPYLT